MHCTHPSRKPSRATRLPVPVPVQTPKAKACLNPEPSAISVDHVRPRPDSARQPSPTRRRRRRVALARLSIPTPPRNTHTEYYYNRLRFLLRHLGQLSTSSPPPPHIVPTQRNRNARYRDRRGLQPSRADHGSNGAAGAGAGHNGRRPRPSPAAAAAAGRGMRPRRQPRRRRVRSRYVRPPIPPHLSSADRSPERTRRRGVGVAWRGGVRLRETYPPYTSCCYNTHTALSVRPPVFPRRRRRIMPIQSAIGVEGL